MTSRRASTTRSRRSGSKTRGTSESRPTDPPPANGSSSVRPPSAGASPRLSTERLGAPGVCDRRVVLDRGQVVAPGATEELTSLVAESEYVVDVDPGDEPGIVLLVDALRRQAWVREVDIDGSQLRIRVGHPELAALRIAP